MNFARVPKKRPKLRAKTIRERDGNRCQYTGELLKPEEGSLDHVVPRSRGGKDAWENLVWSSKDVNTRKGNRLPHEAGLKLLNVPRAPKELPASALIRNAHSIPEWKLFGQLFRKEITYFNIQSLMCSMARATVSPVRLRHRTGRHGEPFSGL